MSRLHVHRSKVDEAVAEASNAAGPDDLAGSWAECEDVAVRANEEQVLSGGLFGFRHDGEYPALRGSPLLRPTWIRILPPQSSSTYEPSAILMR